MDKESFDTLTKAEKDFCELYVSGDEIYGGNVRRCYSDVFGCKMRESLMKGKMLLQREDVDSYVSYLREIMGYTPEEIKKRATENLLYIAEETAHAEYTDREGHKLSPAALRSVSVNATKAIMDMYPVKVSQESKISLEGGEGAGITFNVLCPEKEEKSKEENQK